MCCYCVCDRYFEGGVSSVYLWDLDNGGFAGVVLVKKAGDGSKKIKVCLNIEQHETMVISNWKLMNNTRV